MRVRRASKRPQPGNDYLAAALIDLSLLPNCRHRTARAPESGSFFQNFVENKGPIGFVWSVLLFSSDDLCRRAAETIPPFSFEASTGLQRFRGIWGVVDFAGVVGSCLAEHRPAKSSLFRDFPGRRSRIRAVRWLFGISPDLPTPLMIAATAHRAWRLSHVLQDGGRLVVSRRT